MNRPEPHRSHLPGKGRRLPVSSYRLQLQPDFTFDDARAALDHLQALGVTDIYLSPILQATPGSTHGYDVVDHSRISADLGGRAGFERLAADAHGRGMGVIVDVVPNHMAFPTPLYHNRALWSVLKDGPESPYATWFDGTTSEDGILMPVLGSRIGTVLASGGFAVESMAVPGFEDQGEVPVLRYFDHVFPLRTGTENLPMADLIKRQHYRLAYWKVADEELNYRRFFDVDTLAAVRVEDRAVFDATHALLLDLFRAGHIDAFRIDHPDGLADPRGYMRWLSEATGGAWIAAEKILEADEWLPTDWPVAGTTGYDASWRISTLQVDPSGATDLSWVAQSLTTPEFLPEVIDASKREVITSSLYAEAHRIATLAADTCDRDIRLRDHTFRSLLRCLVELVVAVDRYRAYVVPGESAPPESEAVVREAAKKARGALEPDLHDTLDVVVDLVLGREVGSAGRILEDSRVELIVRFQQVCGAVTAKGVEDTAFYRWSQLTSLCEVGGSPASFGITPDEFHAWCEVMAKSWPATMTLGSTHDSKRSEDVRSRIGVISEFAPQWRVLVGGLAEKLTDVEGHTANLTWQTLAGTWTGAGPISADRFTRYLVKAAREQKLWTSWGSPDLAREEAMTLRTAALLTDPDVIAAFDGWVSLTTDTVRSSVLSTKAIQLTCLGVADTYQGCETTQDFLVDPDNRAPMDVTGLSELLTSRRSQKSLAAEKIDLTAAILRLRARRPECFVGATARYRPLAASTGHVVAFARGDVPGVVTVATRLARTVQQAGGFRNHTVILPEGQWRDVRSGRTWGAGEVRLADLLATCPAAVLERVEETAAGLVAIELWAPHSTTVELVREGKRLPMEPTGHGHFTATVADGTNYLLSVDGGPPLPDPRSAWQPQGVHDVSRTFDAKAYRWRDEGWDGIDLLGSIMYEMHVGTFTPEGTLDAAAERLTYLVELGVNIIELMPVASFPGNRGWGYDGVGLYAVHDAYGGPAALQRFVDAAHAHGIGVCLDVVYNHLGPSGNYLANFGPYFSETHATHWGGAGLNLDGPDCGPVRAFVLENAERWLRDFHMDGLRLDAVHEISDDAPVQILADMSNRVAVLSAELGRRFFLMVESDLNDPAMVTPTAEAGFGMDAQWDDDVHHALHAYLTGETFGYYNADFGTAEMLEKALTKVFVHDGTFSTFRGTVWGKPVGNDVDRRRFVVFSQNHDQVGNRALGDRPDATVPPGIVAGGAALLLLSPYTVMLFQGQEWGARTPFQFFTDHGGDIGDLVAAGRREEFAGHGWEVLYGGDFEVPNPQDVATFENSRLRWSDLEQPDHRAMLAWYRELIALRRAEFGDGAGDQTVHVDHGDGWFRMIRGPLSVIVSRGEVREVLEPPGAHLVLAFGTVTVAPDGVVTLGPDGVAVLRRAAG